MAKKFPGLNEAWTAFLLCILAHMLLPLLPLGIEWLITNTISDNSITITIAIYAMGIGMSSTNPIIALICILIGFIFSVLYGVTLTASMKDIELNLAISTWSKFALGAIFIPHAIERYNRHVANLQPFHILGQK
ncbi:hypothetical protein F959_01644 [Acinetobacter venetianus RAG-1 = CIP 110063]|uniref:Uncharacterized protein n=1 Tax=Acinetobacter venetianus (strain ATCC 31012 / DSM 23050 / BCRC 14357 / CCUG 45561 / CIP 110063 / KCTC 2702 / LMG 19082 / RAG-1) TaxID=1191460 RepID=N8YJ47_ACIVR|nr:hypothetical protein [Acinetobacter venetianus]ENV36837.1 hypothetical protein F959_01644 [Acinetobacter venetianus RAG-1 = CIP 110063]